MRLQSHHPPPPRSRYMHRYMNPPPSLRNRYMHRLQSHPPPPPRSHFLNHGMCGVISAKIEMPVYIHYCKIICFVLGTATCTTRMDSCKFLYCSSIIIL